MPSRWIFSLSLLLLGCGDGLIGDTPDDFFDPTPDSSVDALVDVTSGDDADNPDMGVADTGPPQPLDGGADMGTPDMGMLDMGTPDTGTPDMGTPDMGTPDMGTPDMGTPDMGTPDMGTPDMGMPDMGMPDMGPMMVCTPGTVAETRRVEGGAGCSRGFKNQALTCDALGTGYQWVDTSGFDGSLRLCSPGSFDESGAACGASRCQCTAACAWTPVAPLPMSTCPGGERTVFVNFDGVRLLNCPGGCDDPAGNRTWIVGDPYGGSASAWDFAPFGRGRAARDEIMTKLNKYYGRFCIGFVDRRPSSGAYSMVVVSDTILLPNHGVCALDCTDATERVCIVNKIADDSNDTIARYTAHEVGHSFGLNHTSNPGDIMETISLGSAFTTSTLRDAGCGRSVGQSQDGPAILTAHLGRRPMEGVGAPCFVSGQMGECIDTGATSCGGTLHTGACAGPAGVRCCTP